MDCVSCICISRFLGPLHNCLSRSCGYVNSFENTIKSLEIDVDLLTNRGKDVEREIEAARKQRLEPRNEVLAWLKSVQRLEDEARSINNKLNGMCKCLCNFPVNIYGGYSLRRRCEMALALASRLKGIEKFTKVADDLNLARSIAMPNNPRREGMDDVFMELQQHARDDSVDIIGIHGMGGVGKTALLRRFSNDFPTNLPEDVDVVIFLELSIDCKVEEIQKALYSRLKLPWKNEDTENDRASLIFGVLSKLKFVLLLDNLWRPIDYQVLGIPIPKPASKCKIIFATRLEDVCSSMHAKKTIKVKCLPWKEAWDLFRASAGEQLLSTSAELSQLAQVLARKCGGLPSALITVAQAMAIKRTPEEWEHAINVMRDAPFQLPGMEDHVLRPLRLSYDRLQNDKLRSCASHFSLYSESYLTLGLEFYWVHKVLIEYRWIGEGIIVVDYVPSHTHYTRQVSSETSHLLGQLKAAALIEEVDDKGWIKIHPMIRAMILWVACKSGKEENKWLVRHRYGLAEAPNLERWRDGERIALGYNNMISLPQAPHCPELVYLDLQYNKLLHDIPNGFFSHMPCLKFLDLEGTSIEELPAGIASLVDLQYLNLKMTKITSLPSEFGALVKLKVLELEETENLTSIPKRVFSSLEELEVLRMSHSYSGWNVNSCEKGVCFEELESLQRLKFLRLTIGTKAAFERVSGSPKIAESLYYLHIQGCPGFTRFMIPSLELGGHLKRLPTIELENMTDLEEVILGNAVNEETDVYLLYLSLTNLPKAKLVGKSRCLEHLLQLSITDCKVIDRLIIYKDEANDDLEAITIFPALQRIVLRQLPEFESLSDGNRTVSFPSLQIIEVKECPKLKKLTLSPGKLKAIKGERSWWNKLDSLTKSSFEHLFVESQQ